ncbi:thioesterase [Blastomyces dermatitidis ATCC 18188]|uniref:Thioesterase n=1 Tax=Ajellomyces dermatitidis (strain ATCC 18188 / CBS 674.68) TaxID=653446 RepID=F2TD49_AJEDA|nr:thioesterase [Blastomyces dermatitidis ATCC 18188]
MNATMAAAQSFGEAIAISPVSSHTYAAYLRPEWCIGTVPHGGYIASLFHNVAVIHLKHTHPTLHSGTPHPIALHLTFLRRTDAGPAAFVVQDTKLGSRTSTLHVTLSQHDPDGAVRHEVAGYITVSNFDTEEGPTMQTGYELYPKPAPGSRPDQAVDLVKLARDGRDGNWERFHIAFSSMRKASNHVEFYTPRYTKEAGGRTKGPSGFVEQWVRFKPYGKVGRWTDSTLGYLVDMFPMMLERFDSKPWQGDSAADKLEMARYWYPTVLLNMEFKKKLPAEGVEWLYSRVQTKVLKDGRMDLDLVVLDEKGEVVVVSNHVSLIVSAQRNIEPRKGKGKGNGNGNGNGGSKL